MRWLLLLAFCVRSWGAITLVNTAVNSDTNCCATTSIAATQALTTGNLNACFVTALATATSVTDAASNTYTSGTAVTRPDAGYVGQWWYAKNVTGNAAAAPTANWGSGTGYVTINCRQYSGLDTTSPLDIDNKGANGTGTTLTSQSFNTSTADEVILEGMSGSGLGVTYSVGTGYGNQVNDAAGLAGTGDKIVSSTQSGVTATGSRPSSDQWLIAVISFKMASSATNNVFQKARVGF